ncbi:MAG: tRNA uridine-5-carboxymethylaminomethyl(34) synthesis enzyme MnmG, partial [bacterium]|nr:tRNA uridine-5-carboxymethylaminomethyl(34) synthesis enzyme MnmG [Candidatus Colousia faecequi]
SVDYKAVNSYLESVGSSLLNHTVKIETLLTRPNVSLSGLMEYDRNLKDFVMSMNIDTWLYRQVLEEVEINVKYAGYIEREKIIAEKLRRLDYIKIPDSFSFDKLQSLSTEARQKLDKLRPRTIGDASRIPGVSPNDINVLLLLLGR